MNRVKRETAKHLALTGVCPIADFDEDAPVKEVNEQLEASFEVIQKELLIFDQPWIDSWASVFKNLKYSKPMTQDFFNDVGKKHFKACEMSETTHSLRCGNAHAILF